MVTFSIIGVLAITSSLAGYIYIRRRNKQTNTIVKLREIEEELFKNIDLDVSKLFSEEVG